MGSAVNQYRTEAVQPLGVQPSNRSNHPMMQLPDEDLDLIMQLVLASGSLKGLARSYGVSYPTIRTRLNRLIARLEAILQGCTPDPLRELLARMVERGELSAPTARRILDTVDTMTTEMMQRASEATARSQAQTTPPEPSQATPLRSQT